VGLPRLTCRPDRKKAAFAQVEAKREDLSQVREGFRSLVGQWEAPRVAD
jgi:hypothetical protein